MENKLPIKLDKPIVFFDCETTGLSISNDRIISLAIIKIMPNGERLSKSQMINPMIPISAESTSIHGITNEMLVDKPKFSQLAKSLYELMKDCYLAGYNSNFFDCPILQEEFMRCGIDFPDCNVVTIDACAIFKNFEKRDLSSAVNFYCNRNMENAHNAQADVEATVDVFFAQLNKHEELKGKSLFEISKIGKLENQVDWHGRIIRDSDGDYCWNFGKAAGKKIKNEIGFGEWVLKNDFPEGFKKLVLNILKKIK